MSERRGKRPDAQVQVPKKKQKSPKKKRGGGGVESVEMWIFFVFPEHGGEGTRPALGTRNRKGRKKRRNPKLPAGVHVDVFVLLYPFA